MIVDIEGLKVLIAHRMNHPSWAIPADPEGQEALPEQSKGALKKLEYVARMGPLFRFMGKLRGR